MSDISHLFLSGLRDKSAGQGAGPRPQRIGPHQRGTPALKPNVSVDLTPEEFAQVLGHTDAAGGDLVAPHVAPISALLGAHLNGTQFERVKEYARHLAGGGARIGLIEVDAGQFRLMCFDRQGTMDATDAEPIESLDPRQMAEAIEELNWDVQRWLLLIPNPRVPEAKALLRHVDHWVLLTTCDHDGIVSCYRTLKGLADVHRPRLSLALLEAADQAEAGKVFRKISVVCQQFLNWPIESDGIVSAHPEVAGHQVMLCKATHDKAQASAGPQWQVVDDFLKQHHSPEAGHASMQSIQLEAAAIHEDAQKENEFASRHIADVVISTAVPNAASKSEVSSPAPLTFSASSTSSPSEEVIDLPAGADCEQGILRAVLSRNHEYVETPIKAPMCPDAVLTVRRDRALVLHVVSRAGLSDLRSIGQAYRWLSENRGLIAMALPQFAIDTHALPAMNLLVDHADLSADLLQPLVQSSQVSVQSYRKLKWGTRLGLLLEAA